MNKPGITHKGPLNGECSHHGEQEYYVMVLNDGLAPRIRWYACGCVSVKRSADDQEKFVYEFGR